jgi:hypothetical protein
MSMDGAEEKSEPTAKAVPADASRSASAVEPSANSSLAPSEDAGQADGRSDRAHEVLERLLLAHEAWYDVTRGYELAGRKFPALAAFHQQGEKYVLSKRAKLWGISNHEYVFFDVVDHLDEDGLRDYLDFMRTDALSLVDPTEPDHMSTNLSLVLVARGADDDALRLAHATRFRKNFRFGLQGWSDLKVAVIDLSRGGAGSVVTNAAGKTMRKILESNLAKVASREGVE